MGNAEKQKIIMQVTTIFVVYISPLNLADFRSSVRNQEKSGGKRYKNEGNDGKLTLNVYYFLLSFLTLNSIQT